MRGCSAINFTIHVCVARSLTVKIIWKCQILLARRSEMIVAEVVYMLISIIIVIRSKLTLLAWDVQLRWYLHKQHTSQAVRNSLFSSASLHCESDNQNLSRLATFIRTLLHSAVTSPRAHLFGIVPCFKSHAIEIRFWWHVYIVVFLKKKTRWNVQPICFGQLTMVLVLQIMAFVRWTIIAHYIVVSSISLSSLELLRHIAVVIA